MPSAIAELPSPFQVILKSCAKLEFRTHESTCGRQPHLGKSMKRVILYWTLSIATLAVGAGIVCPHGHCGPTPLDRLGLGLFNGVRGEMLDSLMQAVTWLGSLKLLLPLFLGAAWLLLRRGLRRQAGFLVAALLTTSALSHLFKLWVERPRPDLFPADVPIPWDWSYPSAHAMQITAAALALLLAVGRLPMGRVVLLGTLVLLVGLSRIYLQVHFPSDVIAGTLAAAFWVLGLHALLFHEASGTNLAHKGGLSA